MKLTVFFILVACLQVAAKTTNAQRISISIKNASVEKLFSEIEKKTSYVFFYDAAILKDTKPVTVDMRDALVEDVLRASLKGQPLDFSINDKTIFVKKEGGKPVSINGGGGGGEVGTLTLVGIVRDENGSPLAGASVYIKRLKKSAITNAAGEFSVKGLSAGKYDVEISYIGFEKNASTVSLEAQQPPVVTDMKKASNTLDAPVVIPYGTTTQRLNTGDVSKITSKEIEQQPVANALAALQGRVTGLVVTQNTGTPGGGFTVQIRGQNSLINGNNPFYVVDGVPYSSSIPAASGTQGLNNNALQGGSPLNYINPYDIESIEVLKDADATAIYGSRAANGAILITTKKGKVGPMRIAINANSGVTSPAKDIKLLNTQQYLAIRHEAFQNDGITTIPANAYDLTTWDTTRYTDWSKSFLQNHASYTDADASVSGGTVNTQYLIGAGFNRQTNGLPAVIPNTGRDQRAAVHVNLNSTSSDKRFKLSFTASYASDRNTIPIIDLSQNRFTAPPDAPALFNSDGSLNWAPISPGLTGTWTNPLAALNGKYKGNTSNLVSNALVGYTVLPGLELSANFGYTNTQIDEISTTPTTTFDPGKHVTSGYSTFAETNTHSWIIEPQANYKLNFGKGVFSALLGGSFHENDARAQTINGSGFSSDALLENMQSAGSLSSYSASSQYKYSAVFGRLNYNWLDKYIINITARRDGSSRFGPGKQFGNFASGGAAWVFSKEKFVQGAFPFLSFGKIRASYGTTGNDQVGDYRFLDLYTSTNYAYLGTQGLYPKNLFNADLAWEMDKKLEGGIELGFFKDRIILEASLYRNRAGNQLVSTPLSLVTGFSSIPANLPALIQNNGQEFELHTENIKSKNLSWSTSVTLTIPHNKLLSFTGLSTSTYATQYIIGKPVTIKRLYNLIGVNDTTGVYQFSDIKGNPTYSPNSKTDLTSIVDLAPKFYGGFLNSFTFKGVSLDILFQFVKQTGINFFGAYGNQLGMPFNFPASYIDHWQKPGDKTKYQMASQSYSSAASNAMNYATQSNFMYSDASFIRLKNLAISWQIPGSWKQKMHLQNCRIYMNAQNLITITSYDGLDPESQNTSSPPKKVWTAGFQMTF